MNKVTKRWKSSVNVLVLAILAILVSVASPSFAVLIMGRHIIGFIQKVNAQAREAEVLQPGKAKPLSFTWDKQTKFVANQHLVDAAILKSGARVEVVFHPHWIGSQYVTKVTLLSTSIGDKSDMAAKSSNQKSATLLREYSQHNQ